MILMRNYAWFALTPYPPHFRTLARKQGCKAIDEFLNR